MVELRQYTLHPSRRDDLIELFDREFVETQEAAGMHIVGQFRDLDDADRFVWIRGFTDMSSREAALQAFYGGPVWKEHRTAAASTMIDSDDVLLLRPAFDGAGLTHPPAPRPSATDAAASAAMIVATIHVVTQPPPTDQIRDVAGESDAAVEAHAAQPLAWYVTEPAENTFLALPVRTDVSVLVSLAAFRDEAHHRAFVADHAGPVGARSLPVSTTSHLRLLPTAAISAPLRATPACWNARVTDRPLTTAPQGDLETFTVAPFTHDGATHDVYRKGEGPAVIVITEMPGISPLVLGFADRIVELGCTAVVPDLFGTAGRDPTAGGRRQNTTTGCVRWPGHASVASSRCSRRAARLR